MSEKSLFIWEKTPFLHYIQFPWRLLMFAILGVAFLSAIFTAVFPKIGTSLAIAAFIYILITGKISGSFHWDNYFYQGFPFTTSVKDENMPIWFEKEKNHSIEENNKIIDINGTSFIKELSWKTGRHIYEINADRDTEIIERTAYFPGWEVFVDEKKVDIDYRKKDHPGLISFKIPEGKHQIKIVFTENTPARKTGDTISVISLFLLPIFCLKKKNRKKK